MLSKVILAISILSAVANAAPTKKLNADCEKQIVDVVYDKLGRYDDTFSVYGYTVIYSGFLTDLAIVRTSDEVEPRDVLVEVTEQSLKNKDYCVVKYKETVADGVTADLDDVLIDVTKYQPEPIPKLHFTVKGTIVNVLSGEIDPFAVGDACLIEVKIENNAPNMVLVTDSWQCDDNTATIKVDSKIETLVHKKDRVKDKIKLSVLREVFNAPRYYTVPFDEIKVIK